MPAQRLTFLHHGPPSRRSAQHYWETEGDDETECSKQTRRSVIGDGLSDRVCYDDLLNRMFGVSSTNLASPH